MQSFSNRELFVGGRALAVTAAVQYLKQKQTSEHRNYGVALSWRLGLLTKALTPAEEGFRAAMNALIEKYAKRDDDGNVVTMDTVGDNFRVVTEKDEAGNDVIGIRLEGKFVPLPPETKPVPGTDFGDNEETFKKAREELLDEDSGIDLSNIKPISVDRLPEEASEIPADIFAALDFMFTD